MNIEEYSTLWNETQISVQQIVSIYFYIFVAWFNEMKFKGDLFVNYFVDSRESFEMRFFSFLLISNFLHVTVCKLLFKAKLLNIV